MGKEVNADDYVKRGQKSEDLANNNLRGAGSATGARKSALLKQVYNNSIDAAKDYASAAELSSSADASELYGWVVDSANTALSAKPNDSKASALIEKYQAQAANSGTQGGLETTLASVMIAGAFIFSLDLLAPRITGNAVGSGNLPVDMGAGILLLIASVAAMVFLFKPKAPTPMPHPEKKSRKTKAKKKRK